MERWSSIQDKTAAETTTRMFSTPAVMERGMCREASAVGILGTEAAGRIILQEEYILIMLNYCPTLHFVSTISVIGSNH